MAAEQNSNISAERLLELNQRVANLYKQRTLTRDETEKQNLNEQIEEVAREINTQSPNSDMVFGRRATNQAQGSSNSGSTNESPSSSSKSGGAKKSKNPAPPKPDNVKKPGSKNVPSKLGISPGSDTQRPASEMSPNYLDNRRPSNIANLEEQIDYLVKIGKRREEAISIVQTVSVRGKPSVSSNLEFAVYYVTDGEFSDRRELLQLNTEDRTISLVGVNAPIFEVQISDLKSVTPMGENRILLKTKALEGYELKMESETSQNALHEALKEINPELGKRKVLIEGILEKKNALGWSAKDVKLEEGHLLYKAKGKKEEFLGLIEIQTSQALVQKSPKISYQFKIETRDGKSYHFRDPNKSSEKANEWVQKLKQCVEDGRKQMSFRGPRGVKVAHLSVHFDNFPKIEQLLIDIQNETGNKTKINELRWHLHEILTGDQANVGEDENDQDQVVPKGASVRGRVSTMSPQDADDTDSVTTSSDPANPSTEYDIGLDNETVADEMESGPHTENGSVATINEIQSLNDTNQTRATIEKLKKTGRLLGSSGNSTMPTVRQLIEARMSLARSFIYQTTSDDEIGDDVEEENYDTVQNRNESRSKNEVIEVKVTNDGPANVVENLTPPIPHISVDAASEETNAVNSNFRADEQKPTDVYSGEEPVNYVEPIEGSNTQQEAPDIYEVPNGPLPAQQPMLPTQDVQTIENCIKTTPEISIEVVEGKDAGKDTSEQTDVKVPEMTTESRESENYIETASEDVSSKTPATLTEYEDITKGSAVAEQQKTTNQADEPSPLPPSNAIVPQIPSVKIENKDADDAVPPKQIAETEKPTDSSQNPEIYSDISGEPVQKPEPKVEPKPAPEKEKEEEKIESKPAVTNSRPQSHTKSKAPQAPAPPVPQPPRPGFFSRFRTQAPQIRQIQFTAITSPDSINHAIWSSKVQSEIKSAADLDELERAEIFELFRLQTAKKQAAPEATDGKSADKKYGGYSIGGPREQRLEMFFKIHNLDKDRDVFMKFFELEDKTKQATFISELKFLQPTNIDIEFFNKHRNEFDSTTGITYWQMSSLCEDKHYSDKVEILKTINEIQDQGFLIASNLKKVIDSCTELQNTEQFSTLLIYCLKLINFINESNSRPPVQAFSIVETLPKFSQAKSTARSNYTMLNALVGFVQKHDPQILDKLGEIRLQGVDVLSPQTELNPGQKPVKKSRDLFPVLSSPVKLMSIMFRDAQGCIDKMKKTGNDPKLSAFIEKANHVLRIECEGTLKMLESEVTNLHNKYEQLMKHLGQDKSTDPGQFFFDVNKFLRDFWQVRRDMSNPLFSNSNHAQNVRINVRAELDSKLKRMGSINE